MFRVVLIIILCLVLISSLTACWDSHEIKDWAYVYSLGVDKGVSNNLRMTVQIPTIKGLAGGGGSSSGQGSGESGLEKEYTTISLDCPTFYSGLKMLNTSLSRSMNYMHTKFFVVSEDLAREGSGDFLNAFVRDRQIRRVMYLIIVKGSASEFIKAINPILGTALPRSQEKMMTQGYDTGFFEDVTLGEFLDNMKSISRQPYATLAAINDFSNYKSGGPQPKGFRAAGDYYAGELPRSGGDKTEFLGVALFDGDKMVGQLNGDETRMMMMASGKFNRGTFAIDDPLVPKSIDTLELRQQKSPKVMISFRDEKPVINLKVFLEGELHALRNKIEYESTELKPVLEDKVKAYIKNELDKTINKCKELNTDVFGFGDKAVMQFLTIQEWEAYNWKGKFKNAEVNTQVEFIIRRTGTVLKTNPIISSEGKK